MRKLKVAQIGTSETAHSAHIMRAILNMPDVYEMVGFANVDYHPSGVIDPIFSTVPEMSAEEILNLPLDAVFIETDEALQTSYAMMAANRGLNISMDKPGSQNDAEFDALIDKVKANGTVFWVNYMYRYNPAVMYAYEKIRNGDIGEVICVEGQMNTYHGEWLQNRYAGLKGGVMNYLGCHMVDIIYSVLGEPVEVVPFNINTRTNNSPACDFGMAVLRYNNGASIAKVNAVEVAGAPMRRSLVFSGTKGTLEIRPIERPVGNGLDVTEIYENYIVDNSSYRKTFPPYGRYTYMLSEFASVVRGEIKQRYSYEYERGLHKLILKTCGVNDVKY